MFRAEFGEPEHYEDGFFGFFDSSLHYLEAQHDDDEPIFHHVIAPALAPSDKSIFELARQNSSIVYDTYEPYTKRIQTARSLGCLTVRLQLIPGNAEDEPLDGPFNNWQRAWGKQYHQKTGEGIHVAWLDEQQEQLAIALTDDPQLLQDFMDGLTDDVPTGGFWALYADRAADRLLTVGEVRYSHDAGGAIFQGIDAYEPQQLSAATLRYIDFWSNVITSRRSSALYEIEPLGSSVKQIAIH